MARTDKPTPTVGKYGQKGTGPTGNMTTDVGRYWEVPGSAGFGAGWRFNYDNMTWEHPASGSTSSPTEFVNQNLNGRWYGRHSGRWLWCGRPETDAEPGQCHISELCRAR